MCRSRTSRHTQRTAQESHRPDTRVSDADRERVTEILREGAGEGRLEPHELEERLDAVYAARTFADLDAVTVDLPGRREPAARRAPASSWAVPQPLLLAAVITLAIVVHPLIWLALLPLCCAPRGHARPVRL
jgi:Domain of unknown function (DUF1707)